MGIYELLSRNSVEAITTEEVRVLARDPEGKRAYVGYEPSGVLHLGHMLTANKLIDLQDAGMEIIILLADVHAFLNDKGPFEEIRATAEQMQDQFIAYGLNREQTEFVYGSAYQLDEDYTLDLYALGVETTLNRARRAMAEIQSGETARVSHVMYPLMQALDIEYLDVDLAVGGLDQRKVHVLAREVLPEIGYRSPTALHTPILADLETGVGKMSASRNPVTGKRSVTISMEDSSEAIHDKINSAYCPPTVHPEMDEDGNDRENPVLQLYQYHVFPRFDHVVVDRPDEYGGEVQYETFQSLATDLESGELHPADAKNTLASYIDQLIAPGRDVLDK